MKDRGEKQFFYKVFNKNIKYYENLGLLRMVLAGTIILLSITIPQSMNQ